MSFIKENLNLDPIVDNVFSVVKKAQVAKEIYGSDNVIDATIGSLFNEDLSLTTFNSFYDIYNNLSNVLKAKYAQSFSGNDAFKQAVLKWQYNGSNINLNPRVIATPGGTGAISCCISTLLDEDTTLIIPNIGWSSYKLMAQQNNLHIQEYEMFDSDRFNMESFKHICTDVARKQNKLLVIINDPCHNPTGYSMSLNEWQQVIDFINELSKTISCTILNDIAYIDFAYNNEVRKYQDLFNDISDNVAIITSFTISKSCSAYGLRCGAAIIMAKQIEVSNQIEIIFEKFARSMWSNISNSCMVTFSDMINNDVDKYQIELNNYTDLLRTRSKIIIQEAKECNLVLYPYVEGFFVTIKVDDIDVLNKYHDELIANNIYTVKVNKGIRIAICSLPIEKCYNLAIKLKNILDSTIIVSK